MNEIIFVKAISLRVTQMTEICEGNLIKSDTNDYKICESNLTYTKSARYRSTSRGQKFLTVTKFLSS
jgi:hypothetical protein